MVECIQGSPALIVDLGSGWGSLGFLLARTFPSSRILGIENSPLPYLVSRAIKRLSRLPNLDFQRSNFLDASLPNADVFVCYLHRAAMSRLKEKLESEIPAGTLLIANTFAISGWPPESVIETKDFYRSKIYCYKVPAKTSQNQAGSDRPSTL